jgi:hypothetical protein
MSSLDPLSSNLFTSVDFSNDTIGEEDFNNFMDFVDTAALGTEILTKQEPSPNVQTIQNWQQRAKTHVLDRYADEELVYGIIDSKNKKLTYNRIETKTNAQPAMFNTKKNQVRLIKEFATEVHELLGDNFQIEMLNDNGEVIRSGISQGKPIEAKEMREFERAYIVYYTATEILKTRKEKVETNKQIKEPQSTQKTPYQTVVSQNNNKKEIPEKNKIEDDNLIRKKTEENKNNVLKFKTIIQEAEIASEKRHMKKKICQAKDTCFEQIQALIKNKNEKVEILKNEASSSDQKITEGKKKETFVKKKFSLYSQGEFTKVTTEENLDGKISKLFQESISEI